MPTGARTLRNLDIESRSDVRHHFQVVTRRPDRIDEFATHHGNSVVDVTLTPIRGPSGAVSAVLLVAVERMAGGGRRPTTGAPRRAPAATARLDQRVSAAIGRLDEVTDGLRTIRHRLDELEYAVEKRKNEFLAMLAHELRNPLAAIVNALQLIRRTIGADSPARQALQIADRQVLHQARLLDNLLDISRVVLGKIALRKQNVDMRTVVSNALDATRALIAARAQQVTLDVPGEALVVEGDADRLEQVVRNVMDNATKYGGTGGTIAIALTRENDSAVLRIRDSGIGIETDMLPRIFDLFAQADRSLARSGGGLGVGLTLVRQLVELHGGQVSARSPGRNRGSAFEIRLPVADVRPPEGAHAVSQPSHNATRRQILIVEDNRDARQALRLMLELYGYRVSDAADGTMGIQVAVTGAAEVVLIDLGLPDVDGYEVARRIRKRLGEGVVLIALTGYGDPESRRRTEAAGFDLHLVKPVAPEELVRVLGSV
jgi:signal transduction histidine kinase/CheY-like chemotaxis protein